MTRRYTYALLTLGLISFAAVSTSGRLLVVQSAQDERLSDLDAYAGEDGLGGSRQEATTAEGWQAADGSRSVVFGPVLSSPFAWLQQQLLYVDALQRAAVQGLQQTVMSGPSFLFDVESEDAPSQEDMLRDVGCQRMNSALRDQMMRQQSDTSESAVGRTSVGYGADREDAYQLAYETSWEAYGQESDWSSSTDLMELEYYSEYYEDYAGPRTSDASTTSSSRSNTYEEDLGRIVKLMDSAFSFAYREDDPNAVANLRNARAELGSSSGTADLVLFDYDSYEDDEYWEVVYDDDGYYYYELSMEYSGYDDDYELLALAEEALSRLSGSQASDDEWADYLERAYEYYDELYDDEYFNGDLSYGITVFEYDDSYVSDARSTAMLASIAEMIAWAHTGSLVLQLIPRSFEDELYEDQYYDGYYDIMDAWDLADGYAYGGYSYAIPLFSDAIGDVPIDPRLREVPIVNDLDLSFVNQQGGINWSLVMLLVLAVGTIGMLVAFLATLASLRRAMRCRWVYVPGYCSPRRCGKGGKVDLDSPLLLQPEECHGAVPWHGVAVEDASQYVPPALVNESVAKALSK